MAGIGGVGGAGGALQVELLEGARAEVVDLDTGQVRGMARCALPRGVREGDVVVDGRLDAERTARLAEEVRALRARLAVPVAGGLDLAAPSRLGLNSRRER
ncbi:DUF3006 domain-containing protein [Aggregicoccus sp. 17bor-14]|uniref:DUF3006 domain-containing protein n=1 Tax=Myxococcaceae TaxID=31 RepID=UPI00129CE017|nr:MULTISPECIES: DUF3006 domain-containing protein [Myxococcaceae]MBF5042843.1 DUF3006 domain-containing protein [Simulacricoccus sp. 17bor-14]MRI88610.1 DUF3006 domain-containing protein [Aggregicoccus sp. 17bor-14]